MNIIPQVAKAGNVKSCPQTRIMSTEELAYWINVMGWTDEAAISNLGQQSNASQNPSE